MPPAELVARAVAPQSSITAAWKVHAEVARLAIDMDDETPLEAPVAPRTPQPRRRPGAATRSTGL